MSNLKNVIGAVVISFAQLCAEEFAEVNLSIEDKVLVYVQPEDSFHEVLGMIRSQIPFYGETQEFRIDFAVSGSTVQAKAAVNAQVARDYNAGLSASEQEDIRYILRTLANSSLLKIGASEGPLKKAGDRIDAVHPLRFLEYVFNDEELKVCMHNIQNRPWVWKQFSSGIIGSFNEEQSKGNIKVDFINNFTKILKIAPNVVNGPIQNHNWEELIITLITNIPRDTSTSDRYNM